MVSHRMMLVKAARDGDYSRAFDIEAAFLNAKLDDPVLIDWVALDEGGRDRHAKAKLEDTTAARTGDLGEPRHVWPLPRLHHRMALDLEHVVVNLDW